MQPETPQYPSDYLDSIASKPPVKTVNPLVLWGAIGGVLVIAMLFVTLIASLGGRSADSLTTFAAQTSELKTISEDAQKKIQSDELRTINSSFLLVLTNTNRDLKAPLEAEGIKLDDKKNKDVLGVQADMKELGERIEDARLNGIFDRTYAREMNFYLKTIRTEMGVIYDSTRSKSLKEVLLSTDKNLEPLEKSFGSFNAG